VLAIDNNLTRKVSANDAMVIARLKSLIAGPANLAIAFAAGATLRATSAMGTAMLTDLASYGVPHRPVPCGASTPTGAVPPANRKKGDTQAEAVDVIPDTPSFFAAGVGKDLRPAMAAPRRAV
jgi:hypothetical protein